MKKSIKTLKERKKIIIGIVLILEMLLVAILGIANFNLKKEKQALLTKEERQAMQYDEVTNDNAKIDGTDFVQFSAFFLRDLDRDGYAEKYNGTCKEIGTQETLYMELNVLTKGYLKDAKIQIDGKNFYLQTAIPKDAQIKRSIIGNNIKEIELNDLSNGTQKLMTGFVKSGYYDLYSNKYAAIVNNINNYSRNDNKIVLTGTYVAEDETETEIRKEIDLTVDWHGTTKTQYGTTINGKNHRNQRYEDIDDRITGDTLDLSFYIRTLETNEKLLLSKNYVEGIIPELNGYAPIEVKTNTNNTQLTYEQETRKFTITRTATTNEDGYITSTLSRDNTYELEVKYPIEAYESIGTDAVEIRIPVEEYYEGYNNPNTEFTNPYKSNVAKDTIVATFVKYQGKEARLEVEVGNYIYNPYRSYIVSKRKPLRIYNEVSEKEENDTYPVRWYMYTGDTTEDEKIILKETGNEGTQITDLFIKSDSTNISMEDLTANKSIGFNNLENFLKQDGELRVYDDITGEVLLRIDNSNKKQYTQNSQYQFEHQVKHIRIEVENYNINSQFTTYFTKELDDEYIVNNFTKEQFDTLSYIKTTLNGYLGINKIGSDTFQAQYQAPNSIATIEMSQDTLSTQETEKNENIIITAEYYETKNEEQWKNGTFLVKIPKEIIDVKINSVTTNNNEVSITSFEQIENENGRFIKINTENTEETSFRITINCDLTADPRISTTYRYLELYAINESATNYYYRSQDTYDLDEDGNTSEIVNRTTADINLISPNSLLTSQTLKNIDEKGSEIVAPQTADVKPIYGVVDNNNNQATLEVKIKNNYTSDISEVAILGSIPYQGNKYVFRDESLGSEFNSTMNEGGIRIPEELQGKAIVYYSEEEQPTKDVTDANNGWKTGENITNWSKVKTYLIDLENEIIIPQKEYSFEYDITIPHGTDFNKTSYSHHGVYFSIHTEQGLYPTYTEPNKIGIRIAEKYNLELTKYQLNKGKLIEGATYRVTEVLANNELGESRTGTTNEQGKIAINGLYA